MSSKSELLALINTANGTAYLDTEIGLDAPAVIKGAAAGQPNSTVTVRGQAAAGYTGQQTFSYKRLDLESVFSTVTLVAHGPRANASVADILDDIATQTGVVIPAEDMVAETVDFLQSSYTLKAAAGSFKWIGQVKIQLVVDLVDIEPSLQTTTLSGFDAPVLA